MSNNDYFSVSKQPVCHKLKDSDTKNFQYGMHNAKFWYLIRILLRSSVENSICCNKGKKSFSTIGS